MEKQLPTKTNIQDNHWLNIAEAVSVVGSIGGTVAAICLKQNIFLASVPLSACVALNLINRKRLLNLVTIENNTAIAQLTQHNHNLIEQMMEVQHSASNQKTLYDADYQNMSQQLTQIDASSRDNMQKLQSQYDELAAKVKNLNQINISSQARSLNSAQLYCQNAYGYEQMGEKQKAIEEYTQAIKIDAEYAQAYLNRGILYTDMGSKKAAVEDLRQAAKLYFEQGDLDNYQKTKNMTQEIHQLDSTSNGQDSDQVLASGLFS
ncbi:tetratricopeptide repeat protein [Pleurocapsa sp. FMAR1]|uniref:tetratricopeptide repeat protein n=1 Tax=Pleurocapsa sp. FMAR1 TaxID=3040204 RepID=UPI0029C6E9D7|nr:tetratricopeptide repeat protein [Pleurocapsa sp. FMAR1]